MSQVASKSFTLRPVPSLDASSSETSFSHKPYFASFLSHDYSQHLHRGFPLLHFMSHHFSQHLPFGYCKFYDFSSSGFFFFRPSSLLSGRSFPCDYLLRQDLTWNCLYESRGRSCWFLRKSFHSSGICKQLEDFHKKELVQIEAKLKK